MLHSCLKRIYTRHTTVLIQLSFRAVKTSMNSLQYNTNPYVWRVGLPLIYGTCQQCALIKIYPMCFNSSSNCSTMIAKKLLITEPLTNRIYLCILILLWFITFKGDLDVSSRFSSLVDSALESITTGEYSVPFMVRNECTQHAVAQWTVMR